MCVTSIIDIIRKKRHKEEREMEKINVNNQMVVYKFMWYIPFEDWSFDDIIYTLVGSIVTVSFFSLSLFLSRTLTLARSRCVCEHCTYLTVDWKQERCDSSEAYHHISFRDFCPCLSCSSRIQIICVSMTRVLHHRCDRTMHSIPRVRV